MSRPLRLVLATLAVAWIAGIALAGIDDHHGVDSRRTALAIQHARSYGFGNGYRLTVECATDVTVTVGRDHGGSDLPEVTVWGRPKVGRCHPDVVVSLSLAQTKQGKIVDGTTSQVINLT